MKSAGSARAWGYFAQLAVLVGAAGCLGTHDLKPDDPAAVTALEWENIVARARGTEVVWRHWRGDPVINRFVDNWVADRLRQEYGITLRTVEGQGAALVNTLMVERDAGVRNSADLIWINGETFHQLRSEGLLWGPWSGRLPNAALIDSTPIIRNDFEVDPQGYESPWGQVQFALIYDTVRTPNPPRSVAELAEWIKANPGKFTHDQGFTGITFLKTVMYTLNGGPGVFQGGFSQEAWDHGSTRLFSWVDSLRQFFWRQGGTFPNDVADLHRLFANGEVSFTMSNNHNEVASKIRAGIIPPTSRALLLRDGTIGNAHYLGIPANAPNPIGAMVVANFLLSPEAQAEKARLDGWGDAPVIAVERLPTDQRHWFPVIDEALGVLSPDSLRKYVVPEVSPEYHLALVAEWRRRVRDAR